MHRTLCASPIVAPFFRMEIRRPSTNRLLIERPGLTAHGMLITEAICHQLDGPRIGDFANLKLESGEVRSRNHVLLLFDIKLI